MTVNARTAWRHWRLPLALAAVLILLQAAGERPTLEYERALVLRGEVWRVLTGNLVHLGWVHLGRDGVGLLLIWALLGDRLSEREWLGVMLTSGFAVGIGLLLFAPAIDWYVGVSGVLFGMFCAGALREIPAHPLAGSAMLLGMSAIIAWTLHAGALPGESAGLGGAVVPQAHLFGAVGGAGFMLARGGRRGRRPPGPCGSPQGGPGNRVPPA